MAVYQGTDTALDWETFEADADEGPRFRTLEPGYYPFTVQRMERTRYDGSAKMPPCPVAKLTLKVQDTDGTDALTSCRLFLTTAMVWKTTRFMESIGHQKNENGKVPINWGDVEGRNGWLKLSKRSYTANDGTQRETNDVEEFCRPGEQQRAYDAYAKACEALAPQQQAQPMQQQAAPGAACAPQAQQTGTYPAQAAHAPQGGAAAPQAGYQQTAMPGMPSPQPQQQGTQHPGWGIQ